jgi:hypothetical protein
MPNDEVDTALILEGELKRRVSEVVDKIVERKVINIIGKIIQDELSKYKAETLMEVSINVGKMLKMVENEGRKPLWEATPAEFGLTHEELNRSSIRHLDEMQLVQNEIKKDIDHAVREQTPTI